MHGTARSLMIAGVTIALSLTGAQPLLGSVRPHTSAKYAPVTCKSAPLIESYSVDSTGKRVPAGSSNETARNAVYRMDGEDLVTTVPPADFDAATAPRAELAKLNIPPRPAAGPELDLWKKVHAGPKHKWVLPDHLCETNRVNAPEYSQIHSGLANTLVLDTHNAWWDVGTIFNEPTFNAVCPSASSYSMWPGIGDNQTHLIQAGTDVDSDGDGPNDIFAWYELIGPDAKNPEVEIPSSSLAVNANDQMWVEVTYDNSAQKVDFDIANLTTGQEYFGAVGDYKGHDAHFYYSGDSLQLIAERATLHTIFGDQILQLRQPQGNKSTWLEALGNRELLNYGADLWEQRYMTSDGKSTGTLLSNPSHVQETDTTNTWQDDWHACS